MISAEDSNLNSNTTQDHGGAASIAHINVFIMHDNKTYKLKYFNCHQFRSVDFFN